VTGPTFPPTDAPPPRTGGGAGYLRIATEEAFATPEIIKIWLDMIDSGYDDPGFRSLWGFYGRATAERPRFILQALQDLGERRLADMDASGVDRQVISLTAPGVQVLDKDLAVAQAALVNDRLAEACANNPGRFCGLTAIAPQAPAQAAAEIERGKHTLGFHEVIWGFAVETGTHLLRMITSGVFDRFPRLKVVVGHLGEALPCWLYRLDYMHAATVWAGRYDSLRPRELKPSEYMRRNVWVTTSGMAWAPAIMFCREVVGADRVLYAMDYPYEYVTDEVRRQDDLPLTVAEKKQFFQTNAELVFGLPASPGD